jgi:hypothetical protein
MVLPEIQVISSLTASESESENQGNTFHLKIA